MLRPMVGVAGVIFEVPTQQPVAAIRRVLLIQRDKPPKTVQWTLNCRL